MRVQRVDRPCVVLPFQLSVAPYGQRRVGSEQPPDDLGVAVSAVVQDDEQPGQALDDVAGGVEEDLRHDHRTFAADADEVPLSQLLLDLRDRDAHQLGDMGQVVDVFGRVEHIVSGRNTAHGPSVGRATRSREAVGEHSWLRTMCAVETHQQSDPLAGVVLDGRYRVDTLIATGGMSRVYRGLDLRLDRPVALKVMDSRYAGDHQFLTRFQREARAVAKLKDPGLVAVYDQGIDGQHPFLVMELVEGGTLRELLVERGPMPPHAVAAVLGPVLGGLAVAHHDGLVHRDVKPENVLISDDGDVKIADFGLVRAIAEAKITSTSVILGTAAYLSPEQVSTGDATPASDVYAVGILTYELLTGRTPFNGDSALAVAYQRMDKDVAPPSTVIGGVPAQFDQLVLRATARNPADRYADADAMAAELEEIVDELGLPDFRVPAPRNSAQHLSATAHHPRADRARRHSRHREAGSAAAAHQGADPRTRRLAVGRTGDRISPRRRAIRRDRHERIPLGATARQTRAVLLGDRRAGAHRRTRRRRMDDRQQPDRRCSS